MRAGTVGLDARQKKQRTECPEAKNQDDDTGIRRHRNSRALDAGPEVVRSVAHLTEIVALAVTTYAVFTEAR